MAGEPITALTPAPTITVTAPTPLLSAVHMQPSFDPVELLPPAAAERLRTLRQRAKDAHTLVPEFEIVRQANLAKIEAGNRLTQLQAHPSEDGFNLRPDHLSVKQAQRLLDTLTADLARLTELQEVRAAAWRACGAALAACEEWLKHGRPHRVVLQDFDGPVPKLAKGEDVLAGIERLRRRGRELRADLHRIESAPYPSSHCKAKMREQISAMAQQGAPSVSRLVELDGPVDFQTQNVRSEVFGGTERSLASAQVPDTLALLAWLHRDALIAKLDAEIDAEGDDEAALSHEARQKAEAELRGDLLDIERQEASFVWSAIDQKLPVEFRSDINPIAVLQVQLVTPAATNGQGTSGMHAYDVVYGGGR